MNEAHAELCSSQEWAEHLTGELLPETVRGIDLGEDLLEVGPGYGAATTTLARLAARVTAVEIDPAMADRLRAIVPDNVEVLTQGASALPFAAGRFSAAVCFTMLHHVPSPQLQDAIFAEVARVLRAGGWFAGTDSTDSPQWRELHVDDVCVPVDPSTLPDRLAAAGFTDVTVTADGPLRWRARRP